MAGAYIFAPAGPTLLPEEDAFFREADPWGFILFQRNCETPDQLRRLTSELRESVGRDAPILIDQEGGRVQRMRAPHWREWMPPLDQVEAFGPEPGLSPEYFKSDLPAVRAMALRGILIGSELLAHGIDVNCAPCADIAFPDTHPFLRNRCYGTDWRTAAAMVQAMEEGLFAAGCLPVVKHAPGHGRARVDSHLGLPRIDVDEDEYLHTDIMPFHYSRSPMVMTAHIVLPWIDDDQPVTYSPQGVDMLRRFLGARLIMTDDISMGALSGDIRERSEKALAAGCDLVLHCNGDLAEMRIVTEAGVMRPDAANRADIALAARRTPIDIDIQAAEAEFLSLIEGAANGRRHRFW